MMWRPRQCAATLGPRRAVRWLQRVKPILLYRINILFERLRGGTVKERAQVHVLRHPGCLELTANSNGQAYILIS
jgi:hypothetical protein